MIQGQGRLVTDRVVPVFGRGVWLTGSRRVAVLPDVPGAGTGSRPRRGGLLPVAGTGWLVRGRCPFPWAQVTAVSARNTRPTGRRLDTP